MLGRLSPQQSHFERGLTVMHRKQRHSKRLRCHLVHHLERRRHFGHRDSRGEAERFAELPHRRGMGLERRQSLLSPSARGYCRDWSPWVGSGDPANITVVKPLNEKKQSHSKQRTLLDGRRISHTKDLLAKLPQACSLVRKDCLCCGHSFGLCTRQCSLNQDTSGVRLDAATDSIS